MGRPTIASLARVHDDAVSGSIDAEPYLETELQASREDDARFSIMQRTLREALLKEGNIEQFTGVGRLCHRARANCFTPASAVSMRGWRVAAVEQLWKLVLEAGPENCATWSAIVPSWVLTPEQLEMTNASHLTERFRALLYRNGASHADGWLIAKLDDEFDTHNRLHRLHLHGVACGGMINVLDALRGSTLLRPSRTPAIEGRRVVRPLHIDRRHMTHLPLPLSYVFKGHFSARWLGFGSDGSVYRGRYARRVPEPFGTRTLLWLDRQKLADMIVMTGLAVRHRQLVVNR